MRSASPLRYPGGKWRIADFFASLISRNFDTPPSYVEPYAGGGSLALSLLFDGHVKNIWINDLDPAIHACWYSMLHDSSRFCERVASVAVTLDEWKRQKIVYSMGRNAEIFALGFATFYLNRTNHSGILNAGVIGGKRQRGLWKIDARFNRFELIRRIERIAKHASNIRLTRWDAGALVRSFRHRVNHLVYLDPPYLTAGRALYMNAYRDDDHAFVRDCVGKLKARWVVSYDDVPTIRRLYKGCQSRKVELLHTARRAKTGSEVLFFSNECVVPPLVRSVNHRGNS